MSEIFRCRSNAFWEVYLLYLSLGFGAVEFVSAIFCQPRQVLFLLFLALAISVYFSPQSILLNRLQAIFYNFPTFPILQVGCP